jgi:FixJ family two-component response regulator
VADGGCLVLGFNRNIADGLDLVQTVRKLDRNLPAIFIVGGGGPLTRASVYAAGGFAYLERPIQEAALIRAVNDALAIRSRGLTIMGAATAPATAASS